MSKKRITIITITISFFFGGFVAIYVIPFLAKTFSGWGSNEIIAFVTVMGVVVALITPFISNCLQRLREKSLYQIDIHVTVLDDNMVLFSAFIENVGDKQIVTKTSNLYIDRGIEETDDKIKAKYYRFPFILKHNKDVPITINGHEEKRPDCVLCTRCRDENKREYPTEGIEDISFYLNRKNEFFYTNVLLRHLSKESIQYINPKEKFSEDVVLQFNYSGVYRVTFIVITEGEADCECATKQFYIPNSLGCIEEEEGTE